MAPSFEERENGSSTGVNGFALPVNGAISEEKDKNKISAWQQPSPAAFDFRSDVTTTQTQAMLQAVMNAGLNDGWSASGASAFEAHMAQLAGREAAVFMISSTMGNQMSIRTHLNRPPNGLICDARSHIMHQEVGGIAHFSGALPLAIYPSNGLYLTVEDIERKIVLSDGRDACTCPTRLIHIENPLGGYVMPIFELKRIKEYAQKHGLKLHMDGARLWEAVAAGFGSLVDFCSHADSVNLCLTKGLGAPVGSIVVGDLDFIKHARWVRKSIGGSMRQPGIMAAAAWAAVDEAFGRDPLGCDSLLKRGHKLAREVTDYWEQLGGKLVLPVNTNIMWLDLDAAGLDEESWENDAQQYGFKLHASRIVTHYQISEPAMERLREYMRLKMTDPNRKGPIYTRVPRNEAVARLADSMKQAVELAKLRGTSLA